MDMHARFLFAGALALGAFAAQAQSAAQQPVVAAQAQPATQADEPNCLRYTGSRIIAHENRKQDRAPANAKVKSRPRCNGSAGQSYTREDIQRSGATDVADAIRKLDPAAW
ncbi:MAG TPA: hypothetical protein VFI26_06435 [Lysobacter sp.]|nr:hypothetical protein [Lysobacter sp.]